MYYELHYVTSDVFRNASAEEKQSHILYFIEDTGELYKGADLYSRSVELVTEFPTESIAIGRLYINSDTHEGKIYNGTEWITVIDIHTQSDYDENDETAKSYIKNRPFYDNREMVTKEYSFNGDINTVTNILLDSVTEESASHSYYYYKLSDETPSREVLENSGILTINNIENNVESQDIINISEAIATEEYIIEELEDESGNVIACRFGEYLIIAYEDLIDGDNTITKGTWSLYTYESETTTTDNVTTTNEFTLYIKEFSYNTEVGELKKIDNKYLSISTPDWNQNDENAPDYIKNRICYDTGNMTTKSEVIIDNKPYAFSSADLPAGSGSICECEYIELELGSTYTSSITQVPDYSRTGICNEFTHPEIGTLYYVGNLYLLTGDSSNDNGEDFMIASVPAFGQTAIATTYASVDFTLNITILKTSEVPDIKKIDHKFLYTPDYAQNDENAPDYIKNRLAWTSYEEIQIIPPTSISLSDGGLQNSPSTFDALEAGKEYILTVDGKEYRATAETFYVEGIAGVALGSIGLLTEDESKIYADKPYIIILNFSDGSMSADMIRLFDPDKFPDTIEPVADGTYTLGFSKIDETVKKIDNKYIDLPVGEYSEEIYNGTINMAGSNSKHMPAFIEVIEGKDYEVIIDGVSYYSTAWSNEEMLGVPTIGINDIDFSNNCPLAIMYAPKELVGNMAINLIVIQDDNFDLDNDHTLVVKICTIKKLDSKFIDKVESSKVIIDDEELKDKFTGDTLNDALEELQDIDNRVTALEKGVSNTFIKLIDTINGFEYVVEMRNGNLISLSPVKSIEVTKMPNKTSYKAGEGFDPTGMEVTATLTDGTKAIITEFGYPTIVMNEHTSFPITHTSYGNECIDIIELAVEPFNASALVDFTYTTDNAGMYTLTGWKGTTNGVSSTRLIVPANGLIIV